MRNEDTILSSLASLNLDARLDSRCMAVWRNGNASDYESGDCRFDPCLGHCSFTFFFCFRVPLAVGLTVNLQWGSVTVLFRGEGG